MSNYLNHLVARSLNLIDTVQPLLVSVFEPLPESVGLVEEADFNREQLPVTDTSEENNFETEQQTWTSTVPGIEQPLEWRSPATLSIPDTDLYTTGSASLNIEPHSVTTDIFDPNENRYNLQTPDELNYPQSPDLTPTPARNSGQLPTSSSQLVELANSELSPSQPLSESVVIPPALVRGLPTPDRQPLTPAIESETNASLTSPSINLQQQPLPAFLQKQPIEINRVAFSFPLPEVISSQLSPNQSRPELIEISPATDRLLPAPDRQPLTRAIAPETHAPPSSFSAEPLQQPVPESQKQQSIEINRVVSLLQTSHQSNWQLSPSQPQPAEPVVIQPTTDTERMPPSPDRQPLTGAIDPETKAVPLSFNAQQQQQPVSKSEKQQSVEIKRAVSLLQTSHQSNWQLSPSQPQPAEPVVIQPTTDTERMPPSPDRQPLTGAIAQETHAASSSFSTQQQQQPVSKSKKQQSVEINRVVSLLQTSHQSSGQLSPTQPQSNPVVIPLTTETMPPTPDRQPLPLAIAPETHAASSSFSTQQQQQLVPESEKQQSIEINRVVSLLQTSHQSNWQLSPTQPQPEPVVIQPTTDTQRVAPIPDRQPLTGTLAEETHAAVSSFSAQQQGQHVPKSEKQPSIEINRVVSLLQTSHQSNWQLSPTQPQPEPVVIQPTTDTQRMLPTPDRQPLTGAIAQESHAASSSFSTQQQQQPVPKSQKQQSIEINRVVSSSHPLQVVSPQLSNTARLVKFNTGDPPESPLKRGTYIPPFSRGARGDRSYPSSIGQASPSQPQSELEAIQPATERVSRTSDQQALTPAIEAKTNAALSIPVVEQQKQPAPRLSEIQRNVINRIVSSTQPPAVAPSPELSFIQTSDHAVSAVSTSQQSVTPPREPTELAAARLSAIPTPNLTGQPAIASVVVQPEVSFSSSNLPNSRRQESRTRDEGSTSSEFTEIPRLSPTKIPLWIDEISQHNLSAFDIAPMRFGREELPQERESSSNSATPQTVQVTIGRLEIRATPPPAPPRPKPRPAPVVMSLDQYLRRRAGGGKR